MKTTKKLPLEILLFNLLGKPTLTLIKTFGGPAKEVRQRPSFNYIYSTNREHIEVMITGNKVKSFRLERVFKSDSQCKAYMGRMWLILRRGGYNPRKLYGKLKSKKDGKVLEINCKKRDDSYYDVEVSGYLS